MADQSLILKLQDRLTGDLIGLARSAEGNLHRVTTTTHEVMRECLVHTIPGADVSEEVLQKLIAGVEAEKRNLVPNCFGCAAPCGRTNRFDMETLWNGAEESSALRVLLLQGLRSMAFYAHQLSPLEHSDENINMLFYKGLFAVGRDDWSRDDLLDLCLEVGAAQLKDGTLLTQK